MILRDLLYHQLVNMINTSITLNLAEKRKQNSKAVKIGALQLNPDNSNSDNSKSPLIRSNLCPLRLDFTPIIRSLITKLNEKQQTVSDQKVTMPLSNQYSLESFFDNSLFVYLFKHMTRKSDHRREQLLRSLRLSTHYHHTVSSLTRELTRFVVT